MNLVRVFGCGCSVACLALLSLGAHSAETSLKGGSSLNYTYDDNIRVTTNNQITLSGTKLNGYVDAAYSTARFSATSYLKLGIERYDYVDLDTDSEILVQPKTSDFDNESQDLNATLSYGWEHHSLTADVRYARDSTLNTQFEDAGSAGLREIEGASQRTTSTAKTQWRWQLTERQQLDTTFQWQIVDYESAFYTGYDYNSIVSNWNYELNERLSLQVQPYFSKFENDRDIPVASDTLGLQVGAIWDITEKWQLNALAGSARVTNKRSGFAILPNPVTGLPEVVELKDEENSSFIGDITLGFAEERYGLSANVSASVSPSGDGVLRQNNRAELKYYWTPRERMRLDIDGQLGLSDTTGNRVDDERIFSQLGVRLGYQFIENWWVSARYRYRTQENDRIAQGEGRSSSVRIGVSYRLPKEIL